MVEQLEPSGLLRRGCRRQSTDCSACPQRSKWDQSGRRQELLDQAEWARRELLANQVMRWNVPELKGHDDLLNALALVVQAGRLAARRVASGRMVAAPWLR
jgi:hypothetical protein